MNKINLTYIEPIEDNVGCSGSIRKCYIFNMNDVTYYTYDENSWLVTKLTISGDIDEFEFKKNTSAFQEEIYIHYVKSILEFGFTKKEKQKFDYFRILKECERYLGIIIETTSGQYFYFPNSQIVNIAISNYSKYRNSVISHSENDRLAFEVPSDIINNLKNN